MEFFLNDVELSLNSVNSANSEKLIKTVRHESGSIKGSSLLPVSLGHCGIISVSHARALGSRLTFYKKIVKEFAEFSESNLGKTPSGFVQ